MFTLTLTVATGVTLKRILWCWRTKSFCKTLIYAAQVHNTAYQSSRLIYGIPFLHCEMSLLKECRDHTAAKKSKPIAAGLGWADTLSGSPKSQSASVYCRQRAAMTSHSQTCYHLYTVNLLKQQASSLCVIGVWGLCAFRLIYNIFRHLDAK